MRFAASWIPPNNKTQTSRLSIGSDEFYETVTDVQVPYYRECIRDSDLSALHKRSIFAEEAVAEVEESFGLATAKQLTSGSIGLAIQVGVFSLATVTGGINSLIFEWALWDDATQSKQLNQVPGSICAFYYLLSAISGVAISWICLGRKEASQCWNPKVTLLMLPAAATLVLSESMDLFISYYLTSDMRSILSQLRLPIIALILVLVLDHQQSVFEWFLIASITMSVIGYAIAKSTTPVAISLSGIALGIIQAATSAIGCVITELTLKKLKYSLPVQIAQTRFICLLFTLTGVLVYAHRYQRWDNLPFGGWNKKIGILVFWLTFKGWSQTMVLKILSALWKSLASAMSLCLTYVLRTSIYGDVWHPVLILMILSTVTDITGYALSGYAKKQKQRT